MACHQQAILCTWDAVITCTSVTIISTWGVVMLDKKRPNRHEENSLTGRHTLWQNLSLARVHVQTVNTSTLLWFIERLKQLEAAKLLIDAVCAKAEGGGLIAHFYLNESLSRLQRNTHILQMCKQIHTCPFAFLATRMWSRWSGSPAFTHTCAVLFKTNFVLWL